MSPPWQLPSRRVRAACAALDVLAVERVLDLALDQTVTVFCILLLTTRFDRALNRIGLAHVGRLLVPPRRVLMRAISPDLPPHGSGSADPNPSHAQVELFPRRSSSWAERSAGDLPRNSLILISAPSWSKGGLHRELATQGAKRLQARPRHALDFIEHAARLDRRDPEFDGASCPCPYVLRWASW